MNRDCSDEGDKDLPVIEHVDQVRESLRGFPVKLREAWYVAYQSCRVASSKVEVVAAACLGLTQVTESEPE